ncbi:hypothetical protein MTZ49_02215 [Entomomonas sp. E2T0]|uniref:hypothetical protein n=1 Tax=Entomomonas sp. E2T0 TaxID=2930213 RepID=UPI0022281C14|nr:hypothetical protein [Entomomonas sp. E2T0]UYZ84410.1 hypothetical protein MTZ49_02215 [Entomomonas sp. E2T0]
MDGSYFLTKKEYLHHKLIMICACFALPLLFYYDGDIDIITALIIHIFICSYLLFTYFRIKEIYIENGNLIIIGKKGEITTPITNIRNIRNIRNIYKVGLFSSGTPALTRVSVYDAIIELKTNSIYGKKIYCCVKGLNKSSNPIGDVMKYINEEKRKVKEEANKQ